MAIETLEPLGALVDDRHEPVLLALHEISMASVGLVDARELARLVVQKTRALFGADRCGLFIPDGADLVVLADASLLGSGPLTQRIAIGRGAVGAAFVAGVPVVVPDYARYARAVPGNVGLVASALAVPLLAGDRAVGALGIVSMAPRGFDDEDARLLSVLAAPVGPALEAERLYAESERRRSEADRLAQAAALVTQGVASGAVLPSILAAALRVVPADVVVLFVPHADGYEVAAHIGGPADWVGHVVRDPGSHIVSVLRTGEAQIRSKQKEPRTLFTPMTRSSLTIPIVARGVVVGGLQLRSNRDDAFAQSDADRLLAFAAHAGSALESDRNHVELRRLALIDPLTGLPNRALFRDRIEQALVSARRDRAACALFILDLDRFKEVNESFGHAVGDRLLVETATRLRGALREVDTVARLGGDEFGVVVPLVTGPADAELVAAKLIASLAPPIVIDGQTFVVAASAGIVVAPHQGDDPDTLMRRADIAMYAAKRTGAGFVVYSLGHEQTSSSAVTLAAELRFALERDELAVHYQPIVDVKTSAVVALEALVRWEHPRRGLLAAAEFVPAAEAAGLIKPIELWVARHALAASSTLGGGAKAPHLALNISMRHLHDVALPDRFAELLRATGVDPRTVTIEITESALMAEPGVVIETLSRLRKLGLRLAIDDFGTGYASLAYLKRLSVDAIKIDKSFVLGCASDPHSAAIVRATISLGHDLGLEVVAEGVEDQRTWETLAALGVDLIQGYYVARPMPAAEIARWVDRRGARAARGPGSDAQRQLATLTPREREVLGLLGQGCENEAIAENLGVGLVTVRGYVQNVLEKLDAHSKLQAVVAASKSGLLDAIEAQPVRR